MTSSLVTTSSARGQLALHMRGQVPHPMPPMNRFRSFADAGCLGSHPLTRSGATGASTRCSPGAGMVPTHTRSIAALAQGSFRNTGPAERLDASRSLILPCGSGVSSRPSRRRQHQPGVRCRGQAQRRQRR
jgi:hypothetical protein